MQQPDFNVAVLMYSYRTHINVEKTLIQATQDVTFLQ